MAALDSRDIQGIGVISCSRLTPSEVVEKVIGPSFNPTEAIQHQFGRHSLKCHPLHLSTKYYEADVHFIELVDRDLVGGSLADSIHAVVVYLDNNDESFVRILNSWEPFIEEYNPDVRLLVVESAKEDDSALNRSTCMKWCINHEYELIELVAPEESDDEECENDFVESNGVKRIMQALSAHTWPHMEMHDTPQYKPSPKFEKLLRREFQNGDQSNPLNHSEEDRDTGEARNSETETETSTRQHVDTIFEEDKEIFDRLSENQELEFDDLFSKFGDLKKKAEKMSSEERRLYAEKITLAFWRSLGGSAEEIAGLDE